MRTTLTLDDDVFQELQERARLEGESFKAVTNAALRLGLRTGSRPTARLPRFEVKAKPCGFQAGVDLFRLNQLSDELETEGFRRLLEGKRQS